VTPKVPEQCGHAAARTCQNGASYDKDCKCHCLNGFSGDNCNTCSRNCNVGNLAGTSSVVDGKCQCACKPGYYTLGPTECGTKITLAGVTKRTYVPPGKTVSLALVNTDKAVVQGDLYVTVPHGEEPYSQDGWSSKAIRSYVCGEPGGTARCGDMSALPPGYSRRYSVFKNVPSGHYDIFLYKYLGQNEFGLTKGFALATKLSQQIFIDSCFDAQGGNCATYVTWGCSARTSIGSVAQLCAKSCKTCEAGAAPAHPEDDKEEAKGKNVKGKGKGKKTPAPTPDPTLAPAPDPTPEPTYAPTPQEEADTPRQKEEIAKVMAVKLEALNTHGQATSSQCSGWSPKEGAWKNTGASCQSWGWSEPWCYVAPGMKDKPFVAVSELYPGEYYAPCLEEKQCAYELGAHAQCKSWCATHPQTKGVGGCRFRQCDGCEICCTGCYDKFAGNCPRWVQAYGCETVLKINGRLGALSTFCRKSCNTCPV